MSEGSSTRWWEFYAVRYAMGTGVGALVFYLLCSEIPAWRALLFDNSAAAAGAKPGHFLPIDLKLDKMQLGLLVTYGLIYCYIASAPILVLHASRFLLYLGTRRRSWTTWLLRYMLFPTATAVLIGWSWRNPFWSILAFLFALIVWAEYWLAISALLKRQELFSFYEKLASHRETATGGILDSYRHLREHGNSFFIVALELILGFALFAAGLYEEVQPEDRFVLYLAILFIWILPSVLVWFIATSLEHEFSEAQLPTSSDTDQAHFE